MNEQLIGDLFAEATRRMTGSSSREFSQKFAELIVAECMAVAKYHTPDTEECEYTWLIHDKIKEHFGVEE